MANELDYTVKLVDQMSAPAAKAAASVSSLEKTLKGVEGQEAKAFGGGAAQKHADELQASIAKMKASEEDAQKSSGALTASIGEMALGFAAAAAAAVGMALILGAKLALEASAAKQQMIGLFDAMGEGKITGEQVDDMLDGMRTRLGVAKDAMVPFTTQILKMGINSKEAVQSMTQAALSAKALAGGSDEAANAFLSMAQKADLAAQTTGKLKLPAKALAAQFASMGLNIDDVSAAMGTTSKQLAEGLTKGTVDAQKFGDALQDALIKKGKGPLEKMSLSLANLGPMFKDLIGDIFEDVDASPLLAGLKDMLKLFDQNTASGKAMKFMVTSVFGGLFKILAAMLPTVKHVFLEMVIGALKIYIAAKPLVKELEKIFGAGDGDTVGKALMWIVDQMVNGVVFAIKFYAVMIRVWEGIYNAIQPVIAAIKWVIDAIAKASKAVAGLTGAAGTGGAGAGSAVGAGLVKGLSAAGGGVVSAGVDLGKAAVKGVTSALGIASPSKVMMQLGTHTAEGFTQGVTAGAPKAKQAVGELGNAAPGGGSGTSSGGMNNSVVVHIAGVKDAEDLRGEFPALFASAFERLQLQGGT